MKNLFFDTETSGLPNKYKAHYSETENWPRIVQLSWLIADSEGAVLSEADYIIKVDFEIPKEASRIHGITNAVAEKKGVLINKVLKAFLTDIDKIDRLICHNVAFDLPVLQSELYRGGHRHEITTPNFCTIFDGHYFICRGCLVNQVEKCYRDGLSKTKEVSYVTTKIASR